MTAVERDAILLILTEGDIKMKPSSIQAELKQGPFIFNPNEHEADYIQKMVSKGMVPVY